ncbi:MAG: glycoside hydrolase family 127 protein [Eubacteriales bacterium]|nr:glycoside hydrolase family 127 protein [Eubacteriales bacterium]
MEKKSVNHPISLHQFQAADGFWKEKMELVRNDVLPYQWEILNDRVEGASPSFCMRNFKIAGKLMQERREQGNSFEEPVYTYRGFEALPEDMEHLEDKFYGFVFQDSDFSKWIEAVAYSLVNHPDPDLEKTADEAIEIVCAAQMENGYLDTYYIINGMDKSFSNLKDHHELYCFGHLTEGAVAYYQATGKDRLLQAAVRFADYIDQKLGPDEDKCKGYPGHEIAEMALVRLYEATGEKRYLDLSRFFIDERGKQPYYWDSEVTGKQKEGERYQYYQAHRPVREQDEAVGHAVRAMYLYSGMADVARLTDDEKLKEACRRLWNSTVREKMYITGGVGGTHLGESFSFPFDLPNDTAYAETCAAIGLVFFARRMLEMEPDAAYADVMELALYNSVLSGMALDGKSFFYVNPLEVLPEACHKDERKAHVKPVRQKWFGCACCPPNLARLISSIPAYAYTENEDTLFMHLPISGKITKQQGNKDLCFEVASEMPWNGKVVITCTGEEPAEMNLAVRIPGWCSKWTVQGADGFSCTEKKGYYYIHGTWPKGTQIVFDFAMEPCFYRADYRVREDMGRLALRKGPVVYCAEEADNGKNLHLFRVLPEEPVREEQIVIHGQTFPAVKIKAEKLCVTNEEDTLYRKYRRPEYEPAGLTLIPYFAWANRGENEMMVWLPQK